jgi:hypothetical protein
MVLAMQSAELRCAVSRESLEGFFAACEALGYGNADQRRLLRVILDVALSEGGQVIRQHRADLRRQLGAVIQTKVVGAVGRKRK